MTDFTTVITPPPPQVTTLSVGQGPAGPAGGAIQGTGDLHYTHSQITAASVWAVTHNLAKFPSVTVIDASNDMVMGEVRYLTINTLQITFSSAFSGTAYIN